MSADILSMDEVDKALFYSKKLNNVGVSNYKIAKDTSLSEKTIGNYVNGNTRPTLSNSRIIIKYFEDYVIDLYIDCVNNIDLLRVERLSKYPNIDYSDINKKEFSKFIRKCNILLDVVDYDKKIPETLSPDSLSLFYIISDDMMYIRDTISSKFNIDINRLLIGKKSKFRNEIIPVPENDYIMVEYVDLRVSAGILGGSDIDQLPDTHKRLVPREYKNGGFLVVRVDGDSMYDGSSRSLADGDEVLVYEKKGCSFDELPIRKTLFVITSREGNVLKQIIDVNMEDQYITCHSFNPHYDDFRIKFIDIYQIFVVCKITQKQISLI